MKRRKQQEEQLVYRIPLNYFAPLITFVNEDIRKENWQDALWKSMGKERFSRVRYSVKGEIFEDLILHEDIYFHLTEELGFGWVIPSEKMQAVLKAIEDAIEEETPKLPTITEQESNLKNVKELQKAVREILDMLVDCNSSKSQDGKKWVRFTGREFNFWGISQAISNSKQYDKVRKEIEVRFGEWSSRTATIDINGFHYFDDMGEDASRTLS